MPTFEIKFQVEVEDAALLEEYARRRVVECWGDDGLILDGAGEVSLGECVKEAVLFSSENPSPDEYGINFNGHVEVREL